MYGKNGIFVKYEFITKCVKSGMIYFNKIIWNELITKEFLTWRVIAKICINIKMLSSIML